MRIINEVKLKLLVIPLVAIAALFAPHAQAETIDPNGPAYELRVTTERRLLVDPDNKMSQMASVWKTPFELKILRSMPVFQLKNRSTGEFSISELTIDINEPDYLFDTIMLLDSSPGITPTAVLPTDSHFGDATSSIAKFTFGTRQLQAGECFQFSLRIVPKTGDEIPDYRKVLWGEAGSDLSDNAQVNVKFGEAGDLSAPLFNYPHANQYLSSKENNTQGRALHIPGMTHASTDAEFYELTQAVPEPSSLLLAMLGFGTLLARGRRSKP